jgi:hypothetical protein
MNSYSTKYSYSVENSLIRSQKNLIKYETDYWINSYQIFMNFELIETISLRNWMH